MDNRSFSGKNSPQEDPNLQMTERFLSQGESLLIKGDFLGLKFCDMAEKLKPDSSDLLYRIGLALSEFGQAKSDRQLLLTASKKLRSALKNDPHHFLAAQALGSNLFFLFKEWEEYHFLLEARIVYQKLLDQQQSFDSPEFLCEILTEFPAVLLEIARQEQDNQEYQQALNCLQRAKSLKAPHPVDFWILLGHVAFEYGDITNQNNLLYQSVESYKKALSLDSHHHEGWFHLGISLKHLYLNTFDEDYFIKANECFISAVTLYPLDYDYWIEWAHLLIASGTQSKDSKRLSSAIEKCQRAHQLQKEELLHQALWAEALAVKGLLSESISDLNAAEAKIDQLLEFDHPPVETFIASGILLNALGQYFDDLDFQFQAVEKFQEGLVLDRKNSRLWFLMAESFYQLGYATDDSAMVEKSYFFFQKALFFQIRPEYYFSFAQASIKLAEMKNQKSYLHLSLFYFEQAFQRLPNVIYVRPDWLFEYALALDLLGDKTEEALYYHKAIEILNHVLIIDPQYQEIHHRLGVLYSHLAEIELNQEDYHKAIFHLQIAHKNDHENDAVLIDLALTLTNYSESIDDEIKVQQLLKESEFKLFQAAKLGNLQAYYHLGGLYAMLSQEEKAMQFILKAKEFDALPDVQELVQDAWLENLKGTEAFNNLIYQLENHTKKT